MNGRDPSEGSNLPLRKEEVLATSSAVAPMASTSNMEPLSHFQCNLEISNTSVIKCVTFAFTPLTKLVCDT